MIKRSLLVFSIFGFDLNTRFLYSSTYASLLVHSDRLSLWVELAIFILFNDSYLQKYFLYQSIENRIFSAIYISLRVPIKIDCFFSSPHWIGGNLKWSGDTLVPVLRGRLRRGQECPRSGKSVKYMQFSELLSTNLLG